MVTSTSACPLRARRRSRALASPVRIATNGAAVAAALIGTLLATITLTYQGTEFPTKGAFQLTYIIGLCVALLSAGVASFIPKHASRRPGERTALPDGA